jgi:hypothetical protein
MHVQLSGEKLPTALECAYQKDANAEQPHKNATTGSGLDHPMTCGPDSPLLHLPILPFLSIHSHSLYQDRETPYARWEKQSVRNTG